MRICLRSKVFLSFLILSISFISIASSQPPQDPKKALYEQIMHDPTFLELIDQIRRDPGDRAKIDSLLIRLPLSPLDLFQIRMESGIREYLIPTQVFDLHKRWLSYRQVLSGMSVFSMTTGPLAPVVGTNRNVASNYSTTPENFQGEVQISVNKNNTNQIIAGANTWDVPAGCNQTQAAFSSIDGGTTWRYSCTPSVASYGLSCPSNGVPFGSDPALYWDNNNNAFFNYMLLCCDVSCQFGFSNPTSSLVVAKSTNAGLTWSALGKIVNHISGSGGFDDKEFYIIDNTPASPHYGRHYQCWDNNNDEQFAYSDNGTTWTQVNLPSAGVGLADLGCEMAVQSDGKVHLVWDALTCSGNTCSGEATYYTRSTDGGATWSAPVLVKTHNIFGFNNSSKIPPQNSRGINPFGAVDVDNSSAHPGRLYFGYSDVNNGDPMSKADIYVARSDNGVNWTSVKVNDDVTNTAQFHPFLAIDQTNGSVIVGWHDARNDTANNRKIDFYMSRSTDGGVSWEANTKVSQPSSEFNNNAISYSDENTTDNTGYNPNQYGEYLGVDAHNGKAFMAWTDTRHYFPGSTSNTQKENLGFDVVTFSASDSMAPTTSITAPAAGSNVSATINVDANASDNVGVTKVEFYVDGSSLFGTDTISPYSVSWNTASVVNGPHNLTSKAYDAANNVGTSANVNVNVNNGDSTPPVTSITAPLAGANVTGTITVKASATDNVAVKNVKFYLDGSILLGTDTTAAYSANWNSNIVPNGSHNLTSTATDTSNNSSTSSPVNVNVNNPNSCTVSAQILTNPGFESGITGWGRTSTTGSTTDMISNSASHTAHGGTWYAKLNGYGTANTQTLTSNSATMVIPAEACAASLSFWLSIDTAETSTTTAFDTVSVQIQSKNPSGGTWGAWSTLTTYSNLNKTGANVYAQKTLNLITYKGKTVKIRFQGKENASLQTTVLLDDLALSVTQ